jgi:ubiquinone/menaquinone biosynthesis C-methylase UbiE
MFSDPEKNVPYFGLREGARVADFGAGSGAYTLAMAKRVGGTGQVYAVEVQQNLLERLANVAREAKTHNVKVVWGDVDKVGGSKLREQSVDLVLIANVLFQSDARYAMALEAKRVLRAGGRVVVIDWLGSFGNMGPTPDRVVTLGEARPIFEQAGFKFINEFPAGANHYGLIFVK